MRDLEYLQNEWSKIKPQIQQNQVQTNQTNGFKNNRSSSKQLTQNRFSVPDLIRGPIQQQEINKSPKKSMNSVDDENQLLFELNPMEDFNEEKIDMNRKKLHFKRFVPKPMTKELKNKLTNKIHKNISTFIPSGKKNEKIIEKAQNKSLIKSENQEQYFQSETESDKNKEQNNENQNNMIKIQKSDSKDPQIQKKIREENFTNFILYINEIETTNSKAKEYRTRFLFKGVFGRFCKKEQEVPFQYEKEQYKEKDDYVYKDENDIQAEQDAILEYRINKEDFRLSFLNQEIQEEQKIEVDPVFGTEVIYPKPFDSISVGELYNYQKSGKKQNLYNLISFIPELVKFEINDQQLSLLLEQIQNDLGFEDIDQKYSQEYIEKQYNQDNIKKKIMELSKMIQRCHQTDIPNLSCCLFFKLRYIQEFVKEAQIFKTLENIILINYHVFQLDQLIQLFYGLTFLIPKKCSTNLRLRIRNDLLSTKSNKYTTKQILKLYYSIMNEFNCIQIHYKCTDYLINYIVQIQKEFKNDPKLPLNIAFTYCKCHLKQRFRKKTRIENEIQTEKDKINDLYIEHIEKNFQHYDEKDVQKVMYVIRELGVDDYVELYTQIEEYMIKNFDKFTPETISEMLILSQSCNQRRGIFSRKFLKNLFGKMNQHKYFNIEDMSIQSNILVFLSQQKVISPKQFEKIYGDKFLDKLRQIDYIDARSLSNFTQSSMFMYLQDEKNPFTLKFVNNLLYLFSKQDYWIQKMYATKLDVFLFFVNKIQPSWNTSIAQNLLYHAKKKLDGYYIRNKMNLNDYKDIDQIIRNLQTNLISFLPWLNVFILDYCMEERKLVYFLLKEIDYLYSSDNEEQQTSPMFDLKVRLLQLDDWTVGVIENKEFQNQKEKKLDWLKNKLEVHYKETQEKAKRIHLDKRLDILKHDYEIQKYIYADQRSSEMQKRKRIIEAEEKETIEKYLKEQGQFYNQFKIMQKYLDFCDVLNYIYTKNVKFITVQTDQLPQSKVLLDSSFLLNANLLKLHKNINQCVKAIQSLIPDKKITIVFPGQQFIKEKKDFLQFQNILMTEKKFSLLNCVDKIYLQDELERKYLMDFQKFQCSNQLRKYYYLQKFERQILKYCSKNEIQTFKTMSFADPQINHLAQLDYQDYLIQANLLIYVYNPNLENIVYKIKNNKIVFYNKTNFIQFFQFQNPQNFQNYLFYSLIIYMSIFSTEDSLYCESMKTFSHQTYKCFKKQLKKKAVYLIDLMKTLDKFFPFGVQQKDLQVLNKIFHIDLLLMQKLYKSCLDLLNSYHPSNYFPQFQIPINTILSEYGYFCKIKNLTPLIASEYNLKKDTIIVENRKIYSSSKEITFLEKSIGKQLYKKSFDLLSKTYFNIVPAKIIFKQLYGQMFINKIKCIKLNPRQICENMFSQNTLYNSLQSFNILSDAKKPEKIIYNASDLLHKSFIYFLDQIQIIDLKDPNGSKYLKFILSLGENNLTEEGIIFLKIYEHGFFNEKAFIQEGYVFDLEAVKPEKEYTGITDDQFEEFIKQNFSLPLLNIQSDLNTIFSEKNQQAHECYWRSVVMSQIEDKKFLFQEVFRPTIYKMIASYSEYQKASEEELRIFWKQISDFIIDNYKSIYILSIFCFFIDYQYFSDSAHYSKDMKIQNAFNYISETYHSLIMSNLINLCYYQKIQINQIEAVRQDLPFTKVYSQYQSIHLKLYSVLLWVHQNVQNISEEFKNVLKSHVQFLKLCFSKKHNILTILDSHVDSFIQVIQKNSELFSEGFIQDLLNSQQFIKDIIVLHNEILV